MDGTGVVFSSGHTILQKDIFCWSGSSKLLEAAFLAVEILLVVGTKGDFVVLHFIL